MVPMITASTAASAAEPVVKDSLGALNDLLLSVECADAC
jgi:hypothetical protein